MLINEITTAGAIPTLEASMRFAAQRQRIIAHNIANFDTPDFRPKDASPAEFRRVLAEAVDQRRDRTGGTHGRLEMRRTRQVEQLPDGGLKITPRTPDRGVLFHDLNNRDLERTMQSLAETVGSFRVSSELLRSRYMLLNAAIAERL